MSDKGLTTEQEEMMVSRFDADQVEYEKIFDLVADVMEDENSRLPYIPTFYRTMAPELQQNQLNTKVPKVYEARGEEFCLSTCDKQGKECLATCKEFTANAFGMGGWLFARLHKPYIYTDLAAEQQED